VVKYIGIALFFFSCVFVHAQNTMDSSGVTPPPDHPAATVKSQKHSPKKATLLSLACPGLGQIYNRKNWWWKVPVIYGAGGSLLYGAITYNKWYNDFRSAYIYRLANPTLPNPDPYYDRFQTPTLQSIRDSYRQSRDQCYVWLAVVYTMQVLDAAVEAHFFDFNMNENVSLKVQPNFNVIGQNYYSGVQLTFNLK
jgi:hypothetical protein